MKGKKFRIQRKGHGQPDTDQALESLQKKALNLLDLTLSLRKHAATAHALGMLSGLEEAAANANESYMDHRAAITKAATLMWPDGYGFHVTSAVGPLGPRDPIATVISWSREVRSAYSQLVERITEQEEVKYDEEVFKQGCISPFRPLVDRGKKQTNAKDDKQLLKQARNPPEGITPAVGPRGVVRLRLPGAIRTALRKDRGIRKDPKFAAIIKPLPQKQVDALIVDISKLLRLCRENSVAGKPAPDQPQLIRYKDGFTLGGKRLDFGRSHQALRLLQILSLPENAKAWQPGPVLHNPPGKEQPLSNASANLASLKEIIREAGFTPEALLESNHGHGFRWVGNVAYQRIRLKMPR